VSFSATGACLLSGTTPTIAGLGSCSVTASQAGDASFEPAPNVTRAFTIVKGDQTISFVPPPNKRYGDPPFPLSASASSGLPVSFSATGVCTIANGVVSLTGSGSCTITAGQVGSIFFTPAPPVVRTFLVVRSFDLYLPMLASL
ncbi:MAG: hypothetical protein ACJ8CR_15235, partial [Roseiflexaceae bacterium]